MTKPTKLETFIAELNRIVAEQRYRMLTNEFDVLIAAADMLEHVESKCALAVKFDANLDPEVLLGPINRLAAKAIMCPTCGGKQLIEVTECDVTWDEPCPHCRENSTQDGKDAKPTEPDLTRPDPWGTGIAGR